ncbi:hypothetical protein [Streptomyces sp. NPDC058548]|uniref:hypothetical protein n=1 Tax=unclassified Streptomyces TaxID=2593676 RepID=UPI003657D78E
MFRRSWSYHDGLRADGTPNAGLLFTAWQQDPRTAFVPVQHRLARGDALSRYLVSGMRASGAGSRSCSFARTTARKACASMARVTQRDQDG